MSVVIPSYNGHATILECLNSLLRADYPNLEIVVVDNGSVDNTVELIARHFPMVKIVPASQNHGIAGGRNIGVLQSQGSLILFVDQDNTLDPGAISRLVKVVENDDIGAAGPAIYYRDQPTKIWACGTRVGLLTGIVKFVTTETAGRSGFVEAEVLPAPFIVRREVGQNVGFFDETYFAVFEDSDFFHKVRRHGHRVVCVPEAKAWHSIPVDKEESLRRLMQRSYFVARNRILFMKKNCGVGQFLAFAVLFVGAYAAYYSICSLKRGQAIWLLNYWKGVMDGFRSI